MKTYEYNSVYIYTPKTFSVIELVKSDLALRKLDDGRYVVIKDKYRRFNDTRNGNPDRILTRKEVEQYFVELL